MGSQAEGERVVQSINPFKIPFKLNHHLSASFYLINWDLLTALKSLEIGWSKATDQLLQVVLDPRQVGERTDGHQAAQSKVKQLVAEERDEPAVTMLRGKQVRKVRLHSCFLQSSPALPVIIKKNRLGKRKKGSYCWYIVSWQHHYQSQYDNTPKFLS